MEPILDGISRTYTIRRSQHLGYGFVAGGESPTMVKSIEPNGPSNKRLLPGDVIMAVNGIHVESASREEIIKMIQLCDDQIEIKVRQPTYEELIRARNLADPKFYNPNKSNTNLSQVVHNHGNRQPSSLSPLNRLVTSIAHQQQQQQHAPKSPALNSFNKEEPTSVPIHSPKTVLKQMQPKNGVDLEQSQHNFTRTLGRIGKNYGRHSPTPLRCKSSLDMAKNGKSNKKSSDADNDQPMLKRSNTMRPFKPNSAQPTTPFMLSSKIKEICDMVVIRIFFEDGHTRMMKYDQNTTVGTILDALNSRKSGNSIYSDQIKRYFGLAVRLEVNPLSNPKERMSRRELRILDDNDPILKIRELQQSYARQLQQHAIHAPIFLQLLYRMVYPPSDVSKLYTQDKLAFEYLYQQACNDLRLERFRPELDQEVALKLCGLSLLEYVHSHYSKTHGDSKDPKVYIKIIKETPGVKYFLPASVAENMVDKKGKKIVGQYKKWKQKLTDQIKKNFEEFDFEPPKVKLATNINCYSTASFHELSLPQKQISSSDCIKLLFLNYLSQLPCYSNSKRPIRTSTSPIERSSAEGCSSSLESVPRTSDSSPLIRQDRNLSSQNNSSRIESSTNNNISRLAQMNSIRSLSSIQSSGLSQPVDQPDLAQTPSIESISSITFNMQNSPSPQQPHTYISQNSESYPMMMSNSTINMEPSPMPRQQISSMRTNDHNSLDKLYNQRYTLNNRSIEELLKNVILLPPPPPPSLISSDLSYSMVNRQTDYRHTNYITQVLTDKDIEKLRVPPPPRMIN